MRPFRQKTYPQLGIVNANIPPGADKRRASLLQQEDIRTGTIRKEPKMKKILKQLLLMLVVLAVLVLAGCDDDKGPMQTAGEKVDNAAEKTVETTKGAAETAGDAVEGAADKTGDAVKGAGEAVGNTVK